MQLHSQMSSYSKITCIRCCIQQSFVQIHKYLQFEFAGALPNACVNVIGFLGIILVLVKTLLERTKHSCKMTMEESTDLSDYNRHEGYYFRSLRPDEDISMLEAKDPKDPRNPKDSKERTEMIQEHIKYGSKLDYKSPWLSLTAELDVALAFAGPISRVAIIPTTSLHKEKNTNEVQRLDKEYLRSVLTEADAIARSRRSDEVLVFRGLSCAEQLQVKLEGKPKRILAPGFDDSNIFPSHIVKLPEPKEVIGGPNKRMFRIELEGTNWIALLPRPNYSLDKPVLFDTELVRLAKHQFSILCCYRTLGAPVPRAALYIFTLSTYLRAGTYESAFILLEDLRFEGLEADQVVKTSHVLFPFDVLLGNWHLAIKYWDLAKGDQQSDNYTFAIDSKKKVSRVSMDRALGCTYPEDREKEENCITDFLHDNLNSMKDDLQEGHRWLLGQITEKEFTQSCMRMRLAEKKTFDGFMRALDLSEGLPMFERPEVNSSEALKTVMESRIECLQNSLPFFEIQPSTEAKPSARDGHGAVCSTSVMYVCGGNSKLGALKDLWMFNLKDNLWTQLRDMPKIGRYSFSMHLWKDSFIILYGGCSTNRDRKTEILGDLLLYDIDTGNWITIPAKNEPWPDARCRHGSHLVSRGDGTADMYIIGGMDRDNAKRKDVWKLSLSISKGLELAVSWTRLPDMKRPTHRCFSFALTNQDNGANGHKVFVIGGFGESFRKLKEVGGSGETLVTHDMLSMPASERHQFMESGSLAGFGAVYDDVGERLILIGGGNMGRPGSGNGCGGRSSSSRPFGNVAARVKSDSRILSLSHGKDSEGKSEWIWRAEGKYQALDREYKLPNLLSWSAVYIDHAVILFGGRKPDSDEWSDKIFKVQLHPMYNVALERVKQSSRKLNSLVEQQVNRFREQTKKDGLRQAAVSELKLLSPAQQEAAVMLPKRKRYETET